MENKAFEELLKKPVEEARSSWHGEEGNRRAQRVEEFIRDKTEKYSQIIGCTPLEALIALEKKRSYSAGNYYQEANFPDLKGGVMLFNSILEFKNRFPSKQFRCPMCKGVSTNPKTCNTNLPMSDGKTCDWKSWGLFGTVGKGLRFIVKEEFLKDGCVYEIFMPIELEVKENE